VQVARALWASLMAQWQGGDALPVVAEATQRKVIPLRVE
jgi:hypothetical protein